MNDFPEYSDYICDFSKYADYWTRGQIMTMIRISSVVFNNWKKGTSICPPMPHEEIYLKGYTSPITLVPKEQFRIFFKNNKLQTINNKKILLSIEKYIDFSK